MISGNIRKLGAQLALAGSSAFLEPAFFDGCEKQRGQCLFLLPMTWSGEPSASLPKSLAAQYSSAEYTPVNSRIEASLERAWLHCEPNAFKICTFKPITFDKSPRFVRRSGLVLDLCAWKRDTATALSETQLLWRLRQDWLLLTFSRAGETWQHEVLLPDEKRRDVRELVDQIAANLHLSEVREKTSH